MVFVESPAVPGIAPSKAPEFFRNCHGARAWARPFQQIRTGHPPDLNDCERRPEQRASARRITGKQRQRRNGVIVSPTHAPEQGRSHGEGAKMRTPTIRRYGPTVIAVAKFMAPEVGADLITTLHAVEHRWPTLTVGDLIGALVLAEALALNPRGRA